MRSGPAKSWSIGGGGSSARRCFLPAGTINRVDTDSRTVSVDLTKDQIKDSPELDQSTYTEADYRSSVGDYYGPFYTGY